jgi:hypothetical protein
VKRSALGSSAGSSEQYVFRGGAESTNNQGAIIIGSDTLYFIDNYSSYPLYLQTTQVLRDPSAWYHIVVSIDTTQTTSTNRAKLYINGAQVTTLSTANYPSQNYDTFINQVEPHTIGRRDSSFPRYFSGYLADIHFIDGQALTPSSFTEVSATTGQLIPLAYTGTFGTNGFWLKFSDNSAATAAALGNDYSGNNNDWTPNNLSVTAGAGNDSLVDTPTSFGTDTGVGGEVRGNYATWNPLINSTNLTNGNLSVVQPSTTSGFRSSTIGMPAGTWYWEIGIVAYANTIFGVVKNPRSIVESSDGMGWGGASGFFTTSGYVAGSLSVTPGDILGLAFNANTAALSFYKNGVFVITITSSADVGKTWHAASLDSGGGNSNHDTNFGQRPFAYQTPGTNRPAATFLALCDTNLPTPLVAKGNTVMDVVLYTGNSGTQVLPNASSTPTSLNFSPGFLWIKTRSVGYYHVLTDKVRGDGKIMFSNTATIEETTNRTALGTNNFTLIDDGSELVNHSPNTHVAWAWDAGTTTASNPDGSITSQVRANVSAGFSVATWTGTGSGSATIGHGLGVKPRFILVKKRNATGPWYTQHGSLGAGQIAYLNATDAFGATSGWNSTEPTSTVFSLGSAINDANTYVAYCWAPLVGYSNGFSYTGNGSSDGPMVYLGFRPRLILAKSSSSNENWILIDSARGSYNVIDKLLFPNNSNSEETYSQVDFLSNGFKIRNTGTGMNGNAGTYIGFAWAENPFQYARAR